MRGRMPDGETHRRREEQPVPNGRLSRPPKEGDQTIVLLVKPTTASQPKKLFLQSPLQARRCYCLQGCRTRYGMQGQREFGVGMENFGDVGKLLWGVWRKGQPLISLARSPHVLLSTRYSSLMFFTFTWLQAYLIDANVSICPWAFLTAIQK